MYQKRTGLFETNSSSIHAIIIPSPKENNYVQEYYELNPEKPIFLEYSEVYFVDDIRELADWRDKAIYLHLAATLLTEECPDALRQVESWFLGVGVKIKCRDDGPALPCWIDHPNELISFIDEIAWRPDLMARFVFDKRSRVYTASDSDDRSPAYKILSKFSKNIWNSLGWNNIRTKKKGGGGLIYGKGN
jgi:hypothetical protein